jgi:hypothetical protein
MKEIIKCKMFHSAGACLACGHTSTAQGVKRVNSSNSSKTKRLGESDLCHSPFDPGDSTEISLDSWGLALIHTKYLINGISPSDVKNYYHFSLHR